MWIMFVKLVSACDLLILGWLRTHLYIIIIVLAAAVVARFTATKIWFLIFDPILFKNYIYMYMTNLTCVIYFTICLIVIWRSIQEQALEVAEESGSVFRCNSGKIALSNCLQTEKLGIPVCSCIARVSVSASGNWAEASEIWLPLPSRELTVLWIHSRSEFFTLVEKDIVSFATKTFERP